MASTTKPIECMFLGLPADVHLRLLEYHTTTEHWATSRTCTRMYELTNPLIPKLVRKRVYKMLNSRMPFNLMMERVTGLGCEYSIVGSIVLSVLVGEKWRRDATGTDVLVYSARPPNSLARSLLAIFGTCHVRTAIGGMYTYIEHWCELNIINGHSNVLIAVTPYVDDYAGITRQNGTICLVPITTWGHRNTTDSQSSYSSDEDHNSSDEDHNSDRTYYSKRNYYSNNGHYYDSIDDCKNIFSMDMYKCVCSEDFIYIHKPYETLYKANKYRLNTGQFGPLKHVIWSGSSDTEVNHVAEQPKDKTSTSYTVSLHDVYAALEVVAVAIRRMVTAVAIIGMLVTILLKITKMFVRFSTGNAVPEL